MRNSIFKSKQILKNNAGFTLQEIIVAIVIIGVLAAIGFSYYAGFLTTSAATAISQNITNLRQNAEQYTTMNGGSLSGVSPKVMQQDQLIPKSWDTSIGANEVAAPNTQYVTSYYIGVSSSGQLIIGFAAKAKLTVSQEITICQNVLNNISGISISSESGSGPTTIYPGFTCAGLIGTTGGATSMSFIFN
jgi:prepilin-type N-terminal cleavage/methylation domain-containing protein